MHDIAVIIPLYNKGPHIEDTLTSVFMQSYPPKEIIVVDDASSDNGPEIVKSMAAKDDRIKFLHRTQPGPGGYAARNFGIENASCEWIAFLDADDIWHPDHLDGIMAAIEKAGTTVGCGFSGVQIVEGKSRTSYVGTNTSIPVATPLTLDDILKIWLRTGQCPIWTGASMFRRSVLTEAGPFPANKARRGGDKDMWFRAIARCDTAYSGKETAEFHQDTVNRVTRSTSHTDVPIIIQSINKLLPTANEATKLLLKKLINCEIAQYARHTAGAKFRVNPQFFKIYQYDAGLKNLAKLSAFSAIGMALEFYRVNIKK
ncbi:MAG: glycosyltransferase family 2 protein [Sphingobium sp.]|nr:glycosyltransferase family 2 protein [Sphingobium sp.]